MTEDFDLDAYMGGKGLFTRMEWFMGAWCLHHSGFVYIT
jgi:hypothetical protein